VKSLELPPFYELRTQQQQPGGQKGKNSPQNLYLHALTRHSYTEKPTNIVGGILADSMGLGKSLMILGLIIANSNREWLTPESPAEITIDPNVFPLQNGSDELTSSLTSSDIVNANSPIDKKKKTKKNKGVISSNSSSSSSSKIITSSNASPATLIVCPLSVISAWQDQIESHTVTGSVRVVVYQGQERKNVTMNQLIEADIVLTTYDVLATEFVDNKRPLSDTSSSSSVASSAFTTSLLHSIHWWRVVLGIIYYSYMLLIYA
jgi:SWI/SNF-related matrix-associated actin-dependent regulator of chromatin subfamily A3